MYNDEKKGFSVGNFIIQCLFVLLLVLILLWIFPTKNQLKELFGQNSGNAALLNQIYSDNLDRMKDAAVSYYTNSRLPKNVDERSSMTLQQMLDRKLLVELIDSNNKTCDVDSSYVEIIKLEDEYKLEVHLNCSDVQDYVVVHLGCYDYCDGGVCEKEDPTPVKTCTKKCGSGYTLMNPNSASCYCKKKTIIKTCSITSCDAGYTLVNPKSVNCYCKKKEVPKTCQIKSCPTGYTLMNANSKDCYCKKNDDTVYKYYKDIDKSYWSSWSDWTTTYKETNNKLKRKESTYIMITKETELPTYSYQYGKTVTGTTYKCGDWAYGYQITSSPMALGSGYTSGGTETVAVRFITTLSAGECGACTSPVNYQYYVKSRICKNVNTYSTTYDWFTTNPGSPWYYTGTSKQIGTVKQYSDTKWLLSTETIPSGYIRYGTKTFVYYSYSELIAKTERIYTTSTNPNLGDGWIRY